jgi:outer membrane translocation and assembly module TamA
MPVACAALLAAACGATRPPVIPGATDLEVSSIEIVPRGGDAPLAVDYQPLYGKLAARADGPFNPFQVAEDRGRIAAFLQNAGYFDAAVDEAALTYAPDHRHVAITWHVREAERYTIASVAIVGAPPGYQQTFASMVPFHAGDRVDLEAYRPVRNALAGRLRADGFGRAQAYSRAFIDRSSRSVAWFYYVEPGPETRIGALRVEGNHRVPTRAILELAGLERGRRYSSEEKHRAELALLDSGAFASASVVSEADDSGPPQYPDNGGILEPDQVDASGHFAPRALPEELDVRVAVVEAPARQLRAELGVEADPSRVDAYAGARLWLRDLLGPLHHVVLEGNLGHGWRLDDGDLAEGLYGSALAQYQHPGFLAPALELRLSARWRDTLLPSALLRELTIGPGLRATLASGVFVEGEARFRYGRALGLPALDAMSTAALALPAHDDSRGAELVAALVADRRNDLIEATSGWLAALRTSLAPGGPLGDHRWLQLVGDLRGFVPLTATWSIGARATAGAVTLGGADGIPLGPRLFGGGVDGMRGFPRDHLSPAACQVMTTTCDVLVGGRSLVESSVELRWLPQHVFWGAAAYVDAGAAGAALDPFASGVSVAVGGGLRARTWYLPVSFDLGYRVLDENRLGLAWGRVVGFVHVGEAF